MPGVGASTHIEASPEEVFAAITDLANAPGRISAIKRVVAGQAVIELEE